MIISNDHSAVHQDIILGAYDIIILQIYSYKTYSDYRVKCES